MQSREFYMMYHHQHTPLYDYRCRERSSHNYDESLQKLHPGLLEGNQRDENHKIEGLFDSHLKQEIILFFEVSCVLNYAIRF